MKSVIARVLIASQAQQLDRVFDYLVPESLVERIQPGARVLVPFQNRPNLAYVWELTDHSDFSALKEILEVIDEPPLLTDLQLKLASWLAEYYFCARVDVLKLALPPGAERKRADYLRLTVKAEEIEDILKGNFDLDLVKTVFTKIKSLRNRPLTETEWQRQLHPLPKIYDFLIKQGLLTKETGITKARIEPRVENLFHWQETAEATANETAAAKKIESVLRANPQGLTLKEICATASVSSSVLKRLVKQGKVLTVVTTVERQPVGFETAAAIAQVCLSPEQDRIYQQIIAGQPGTVFLLHGVTGSGKTEIYFQAAASALAAGEQVLYLVPEIALTPQTLERARRRFGGQVALLHSNMSDGERFDQWFRIKRGEARFVIGARSALFAPFTNLGLIVVDEEHESSYKQEETPRYHARDVAVKLAKLSGARVILGSATPALETFYRGRTGEYAYLFLGERFNQNPLPEVTLVDMREELKSGNRNILSRQLQQAIAQSLAAGEQIILLLNRRGYSTFILCRECGHTLKCPNCEITLTYHLTEQALRCHYCDYRQPLPDLCPNCKSNCIRYFGHGTQKLEEELKTYFPQARTVRMDLDSTSRKGVHHTIYRQLTEGAVDILLGTQMVAKGLDLPRVTLVGVIAADSSLNVPDFRAAERAFQLLTQVAGRTSRGTKQGQVIFQAYHPEHYSLELACHHDYQNFFQRELELRRELNYPPFTELMKLNFSGLRQEQVEKAATSFVKILKAQEAASSDRAGNNCLEILGPAPCIVPRIQNKYRWQVLIKSCNSQRLAGLINEAWTEFRTLKFNEVKVNRDRNPYSVI